MNLTASGLRKPRALRKGQTIALVAPASPGWMDGGIEKGIAYLESLGYRVVVGDSCRRDDFRATDGYLAGSDRDRASEINRFFADPEVNAIFCIRGGYGTLRIIPYLDLETIAHNPKLFVGYSDITVLHTILNQACGLVAFHGPMVITDMIGDFDPFSAGSLFAALTDSSRTPTAENPGGFPITALRGGIAEGPLCGGNLTLVSALAGTAHQLDARGKILFLEDVDEEPYAVDRMLTQLKLCGTLDDCSGILLGDWNDCLSKGSYRYSLTLEEVFRDILLPLGKPVLSGTRAGHCEPQLTLPLGIAVRIDGNARSWEFLENATS